MTVNMNGGKPSDSGPCDCGSALPTTLCCGARRAFAGDEPTLSFVPAEEAEAAAARWELSLATCQALAAVLPDVPVPLLANRTPRALHAAGLQERSAALAYAESVALTATAVDVAFPLEALAEAMADTEPPRHSPGEREAITLGTLTLQLLARSVEEAAVLGAQRLFRDVLKHISPGLRKPSAWAAAVDYAICWMHFRPESRQQVADIYAVSDATVGRHFAAMKGELKLVWYDPRYAAKDPAWHEMLVHHAQAIAEGDEPEARTDC